eukprot:gb/GECH01000697.1/.p1 GENE.gb/GECH01000697.1/~~gb/GECH01000697.1/.p1  ORF type:complete len:204 (+),score=58.04 gb/GECH01000697.1/:1-612(+)
MILLFNTEHKEDLSLIVDLDKNVVQELCNTAIDFLKSGKSLKLITSISDKLEQHEEDIDNTLKALSYIYAESSKANISDQDFVLSLVELDINLESDIISIMKDVYSEHKDELRRLLSSFSLDIPEYISLQWRLDVEVASRQNYVKSNPSYIMQLDLKRSSSNETESHFLQSDIGTLKHMCSTLEDALKDLETPYARKIRHYIQ